MTKYTEDQLKELFLNMLNIRNSFKKDISLEWANKYIESCGHNAKSIIDSLVQERWIKVIDNNVYMGEMWGG